MAGSQPKHLEKELYSRLPNYRLQLTALAASAAGFLCRAANDRAAAEAERWADIKNDVRNMVTNGTVIITIDYMHVRAYDIVYGI